MVASTVLGDFFILCFVNFELSTGIIMGISEDNDVATPGSERIDNEDNETTGEINIDITDTMDSKNMNKLESCETIELESRESVIDSEPVSINDQC